MTKKPNSRKKIGEYELPDHTYLETKIGKNIFHCYLFQVDKIPYTDPDIAKKIYDQVYKIESGASPHSHSYMLEACTGARGRFELAI